MRHLSLKDKLCVAVSSLFGIGWVPLLPGTTASAAGVLVFLLLKNNLLYLIFTFISIVLSFLLSSRAEKIFAEKDSKKIVIDDFSGMLLAMLFIPRTPQFIFCAFFLFRALDMVKIPPADKIEKCPGALGVVGDDLVAGIYANIILHLVRGILAIFS
ncbi:MAG: phosphatidylglycerophosphatase A [Candidatus Omnitrophota bacterium]|nr:MAG: phosphatidylglycerophosphatase A [Candidatus Omnitrophota bacterium]